MGAVAGQRVRRRKNYDLTIISHVEPFDLGNFAKPDYYWGYNNPKFNELFTRIKTTPAPPSAPSCWARRKDAGQRRRARLAVPPQWVTVANKRVHGLWKDMPIFVNDLSTLLVVK
jgi:peptide/nickel transport system substrate-binding protein